MGAKNRGICESGVRTGLVKLLSAFEILPGWYFERELSIKVKVFIAYHFSHRVSYFHLSVHKLTVDIVNK